MVRPEKKAARKAKRAAAALPAPEPGKEPRGPGSPAPDEWSERFGHKPVMVAESMEALKVRPGGFYVDGTLGGGGHSRAILERLGERGQLLALDVDPGPLDFAQSWSKGDERVILERLNFRSLKSYLAKSGLGPADGILLDLGLSSAQLLSPERGFSFNFDGPLDMRLSPDSKLTAGELVNEGSEELIADIFRRYGEERSARRLAAAIVSQRAEEPIDTTLKLAAIAQRVLGRPGSPPRIHPATKAFMGLRLAVNDELASLAAFLGQARDCVKTGGHLVVISFHSLEDRLVKEAFRGDGQGGDGPLAAKPAPIPVWRQWRRKVVKPKEAETAANPRARSAKLRAAEAI
ncbi:MAG: 16S rRNA (cytosine(1402)-N(4))-methyltransferase RsmH [Deltaproteobacteria bacterium]|jgi:16S rRNA (cytosine1402-N4)-methyltransferase|nr:16S rRNA (cytosine(1402)-N(4))-methyltransferase RsmH [Deltaproteobacteria bacterium]